MAPASRNVAIVALSNVATPVAAFVTAPILAQALGVAARGELAAATAALGLATTIATIGLPEALTYFIARRHGRIAPTVLRAFGALIVTGVVATLGLVALAPSLAGSNDDLTRLIYLVSVAVAPTLVVAGARGVAAGLNSWTLVTVERLITAISRLAAVVLLAISDQLTPTSGAIAIATTGILGGVAYLPLLRSSVRSENVTPPTISALLVFGTGAWSGSVAGILVSRLDQILIVPLSGEVALGLYVVAVSLSEIALVFNNALRDVMFSVESGSPDPTRLQRATRVSTGLTAVTAVAVGLAAVWFTVPLFGPEFAASVPVTLILLLGVTLGNFGSIAGIGLSARGRPALRSVSLAIGLGINFVLVVLLVPQYGAIGAAWATVAGNVAVAAANLGWVRLVYKTPILAFFIPRTDDFTYTRRMVANVFKR